MALIKCPECGKDISDKAKSCINCGFPLREYFVNSIDIKTHYDNPPIGTDVKNLSLNEFFEQLFKYSLKEADYVPISKDNALRYSLHFFAIVDILQCYEKGYDRYASIDWMEKNADRVYNEYSDYSQRYLFGKSISEYYLIHRIGRTKLYKEALADYTNAVDDIFKYDKYTDELLSLFFNHYYKVLQGDNTNELLKEEALKENLILTDRIKSAVTKFSKITITNDYVREEPPSPQQYGLTEEDVEYFKNLEKSEINKEESKGCLIPIIVLIIVIAICFIIGERWFAIFAPVIALLFIDRDDTSSGNIRKKVHSKDSRSQNYYSFHEANERYKSKYEDGRDEII